MTEVTILTKETVDVKDSEAPIQDAEHILSDLLYELKLEGKITGYSVVGPYELARERAIDRGED